MKNNISFVFSVFVFLALALSFTSAAITVTGTLPSTLNISTNYQVALNVTNTGSSNATIVWTGSTNLGSWTYPASFNLTAGSSTVVNAVLNLGSSTGSLSASITATNSQNTVENATKSFSASVVVPVTSTGFCDFGNQGTNLSISDFNINNNGEGEDDDWYLLDDVEVEVEVSNNENKRINDVEVEIAIYSGNEDVTDDFDVEDEKISLGSIKDDDEEVATFVIKNIPADMGTGDYTLKVKAYVKGDEDIQCKDNSESIQVSNPFGDGVVVFNGVIGELIEAVAGSTLEEVSMEAINLGSDKEDEILVTLYNRELGIDEKYNLDDLRSGDSEVIYFPLLEIPAGAASKTYKVDVETFFDYDDGDVLDQDSYDASSYDDLEDDYNTFSFNIRVAGSNQSNMQDRPTITADLKSSAEVGKELVVELTVRNNKATAGSYIVSVGSYDSWATLASVDPSSLNINANQEAISTVTLSPTEAGQKTFNIVVVYDGKTVDQPVTVNIVGKQNLFGGMNTTTWLIVGIVVLVLLIVVILILKAIFSRKE